MDLNADAFIPSGDVEQGPPFPTNPEEMDQEQTQTDQTQDELKSPLENLNEFEPELGQEKIISEISSAAFNNFTLVLKKIVDKQQTDCVSIKDSYLKQNTPDAIITADLRQILNYQNQTVTFDIVNPKSAVSKFSEFRHSNNIFIIDDSANSRYQVTNGQIYITLPKKANTPEETVYVPDLSKSETISETIITKDVRTVINTIGKEENSFEYLIHDNKIKAMHFPSTLGKYVFEDFINDSDAKKLDDTNSDLALRTSIFLPIDANEYKLQIVKLNDEYLAVTDCNVGGNIPVRVIETVHKTTGGNLLF